MKVLFVLAHTGIFRHFDRVVRELCARGHEVTVLRGALAKENISDRALEACQADFEACRSGWVQVRRDRWGWAAYRAREVVNYLTYLRPGHPSPALAGRWEAYLPWPAQLAVRNRALRPLVCRQTVRRVLAWAVRRTPPSREILRELAQLRPRVVVASPFIYTRSPEVDYLAAASALGIPTLVAVASWDNLTTKGTFHHLPDAVLVWNEGLKREAVELHDLPAERVIITGAPTFDFWFDLRPSRDRTEFCQRVGLDPRRPYVAYLCSSKFIAGDETSVVRALSEALARAPSSAPLEVLVRPHPLNAEAWKDFSAPGVAVFPREGDMPDAPEAMQDYYDTLHHAVAVAGVNTSALLDAAIVDRPCLSLVADRYRTSQREIGHFQHLLRGGFLELAGDFHEAAVALGAVLAGRDARASQRRAFVREFLRPWGMELPASRVVAAAIELLATAGSLRPEELARSLHAESPTAAALPVAVSGAGSEGGQAP